MKKTLRSLSILLVVSLLAVILAACSGSSDPTTAAPAATTAPAADAEIKIDSFKLMKDNGSGAAGDEVKSFKPSDHVQYFDIQLTAFMKTGAVAKLVFTSVDTAAGKDVKITETDINVVVGNKLTANLKLEKDFPVGSYKIDVLVDGKPIGTVNYTVAE